MHTATNLGTRIKARKVTPLSPETPLSDAQVLTQMDTDGQWTGNYSGSNKIKIDDHGAESENYLQRIVQEAIFASKSGEKNQTLLTEFPRTYKTRIFSDCINDGSDGYGYRGYNHIINLYFDTLTIVRKNLCTDARSKNLTRDEVCAEFITQIGLLSKSEPFKTTQRNLEIRSKQNFKASCTYISKLFNRYAKLLVLRLDLYYEATDVKDRTDESAREDLQHLFNNRRSNALFKSWVGYIAKMEYGEKRGLHFHLIIFLDGNFVKNHQYYGIAIGKYWSQQITKGSGWFNCSNQDAEDGLYKHMGVGAMGYDDTEKRYNLEHYVVAYLCKKDQFLRAKDASKVNRAFTKGSLRSKTSAVKLGRPRKVALVEGKAL